MNARSIAAPAPMHLTVGSCHAAAVSSADYRGESHQVFPPVERRKAVTMDFNGHLILEF